MGNSPELLATLKKRMLSNKMLFVDSSSVESEDNAELVRRVRLFLWKVLGFAEVSIVTLEQDLIGVRCGEELQYVVEVGALDAESSPELDSSTSIRAYSRKLRDVVKSDGSTWRLYTADRSRAGKYLLEESVTLSTASLDSETDISHLARFSAEKNSREVATDINNRKRWYGFWEIPKKLAAKLFLVEFALYEDFSERVHIPLLDITIWGDEPFEARKVAWDLLGQHMAENSDKATSGTFEMTANCEEKESFRADVSFETTESQSPDEPDVVGGETQQKQMSLFS